MNTQGQPTAKTPIQPSGISDPENELSSNPQFLLEQLRVQKQENQQLQLRLNQLQDQLDLLVRLLYGSKSEKRPPEPTAHEELSLFAESELSSELLAHKQQPQLEVQAKASKSRERKTGRITFSKDLPTEIVVLKPDCCLRSTGIDDFQTGWGKLFDGKAIFKTWTHQQWVQFVRGNQKDGEFNKWLEYLSERYGY
jgi:hypothetical protein